MLTADEWRLETEPASDGVSIAARDRAQDGPEVHFFLGTGRRRSPDAEVDHPREPAPPPRRCGLTEGFTTRPHSIVVHLSVPPGSIRQHARHARMVAASASCHRTTGNKYGTASRVSDDAAGRRAETIATLRRSPPTAWAEGLTTRAPTAARRDPTSPRQRGRSGEDWSGFRSTLRDGDVRLATGPRLPSGGPGGPAPDARDHLQPIPVNRTINILSRQSCTRTRRQRVATLAFNRPEGTSNPAARREGCSWFSRRGQVGLRSQIKSRRLSHPANSGSHAVPWMMAVLVGAGLGLRMSNSFREVSALPSGGHGEGIRFSSQFATSNRISRMLCGGMRAQGHSDFEFSTSP